MQTKTIFFSTNINQKLGCQAMIHIDLAPSKSIPESTLENTIIEIRTKDNSFPPTFWKLTSLLRLELHELTDLMVMPSHGIEAFEFQKQMIINNEMVHSTTPVAIYYYQKN